MKRIGRVLSAAVSIVTASFVATPWSIAAVCDDADPGLELAGVNGDFELTPDYQDPEQRILFVSNTAKGSADVVVARINSSNGLVVTGTLTRIARNFTGTDGPEWVQKPTGELGFNYSGAGGVHSVFRSNPPVRWNDFSYDVNGTPLLGDPPTLSNTSDGAVPKGGTTPLGQITYAQKDGLCGSICYAALTSGTTTDAGAWATSQGHTLTATTQSPRDGWIYAGTCETANPTSCGLHEALIDNAGSVVKGSHRKIKALSVPVTRENLRAARHPVTGTIVIFSGEDSAAGSFINVWEQKPDGGQVTLLSRIQVPSSSHYRIEHNTTELVMHWLIQSSANDPVNQGSYTIPVTANGSQLVVGANQKISTASDGAEFVWAPGAARWALYYNDQTTGVRTRCWVDP